MKQVGKIALMLLLPVTVLMSGCIKEDLDDCRNVSFSFRYLADGDKNVLPQYINKINLYVFNEENRLVDTQYYNQDALKSDDTDPTFRLPEGTYTVVALGNVYERTAISGLETYGWETTIFHHPGWKTDEVISGHDHNYLGRKTIHVPGGNVYLHEVVDLYSSHINVSVEVQGLKIPTDTRANVTYELSFENANAETNFKNEIVAGKRGTCYPEFTLDAASRIYRTDPDFALFRMDRGGVLTDDCCRHMLVLRDAVTDEILTTVDIRGFLEKNKDKVDVTKQEALLPIFIKFTPVEVTVELPEWYIKDVTPGWQ